MTQNHPPKVEALYRGTLSLIGSSRDLSDLTVQQIATAAGVGKGTVYEYFDSREELIGKSLLYGLRLTLKKIQGTLRRQTGFSARWMTLLGLVEESVCNHNALMQLLLNLHNHPVLCAFDDSEQIKEIRQQFEDILREMLTVGEQDGLYTLPDDDTYLMQAVASAFLGFLQSFCRQTDPQKLKRSKEISLELLLKMLNVNTR